MPRTYALLVLILVASLAACSNDPDPENRRDDGGGANRRCADGGGTGRCGGGAKDSGKDSGKSTGKDSGKDGATDSGKGDGGAARSFANPLARTDIEGKVTDFAHVMALWDEANHSVRVVASTQPIPADQIAGLREGHAMPGETPHMLLSFVLREGTASLSMKSVENLVYGFHNLTSLSPMNLTNIGEEAIVEFSGKPRAGEKIRLFVEFRGEKIKDAPAEKIHFDFAQELELK